MEESQSEGIRPYGKVSRASCYQRELKKRIMLAMGGGNYSNLHMSVLDWLSSTGAEGSPLRQFAPLHERLFAYILKNKRKISITIDFAPLPRKNFWKKASWRVLGHMERFHGSPVIKES